jgi:anti-anti-sigma factor
VNDLAEVWAEQRDGLCLVRVEGEVDMSNAQDVSAAIEDAVPNSALGLVLDLTATTYLNSAGIGLLFRLAGRSRVRRQLLRIVVPEHAPIRAVLELTRLSLAVPLHQGLDDAIAELAAAGPGEPAP